MKGTFLFAILIGVTVLAKSESQPQPFPTTLGPNTTETTTPSSPSPSTTTVTPSTTTPSPNTTTVTPSTTTPSPNTTTVTPSTTTPSPNTTTVTPPTTTTPVPPTSQPNTTSTSAPPTTTPTPPGPKTGKWIVKKNNVTCIVADMALQLNITFSTDKLKPFILDVPDSANATGTCDGNIQTLELVWETSNITSTIAISFEKNDTTKVFFLANVKVSLPRGVIPNFNESLNLFEKEMNFSTPLSKSYKCAKVQELNLTDSGNSTTAVLQISHVQFEAFREKEDNNFGSAEDCEPSSSSTDVVPIAVGCVLVGLVVIVLVAYLVGRRRSQSRGYLSM